jgi:HAMP domain-containing protein
MVPASSLSLARPNCSPHTATPTRRGWSLPVRSYSREQDRSRAAALLDTRFSRLTDALSATFDQWVHYNEDLAFRTRDGALGAIAASRRNLAYTLLGMVLAVAWLGVLLFRQIIPPIHGLRSAVEAIAAGDYQRPVPFTAAADETGQLARSVAILKDTAAATDHERWIKDRLAAGIAALPDTGTVEQFGERLLAQLAPELGAFGGRFFLVEDDGATLRLVASRGFAAAPENAAPPTFACPATACLRARAFVYEAAPACAPSSPSSPSAARSRPRTSSSPRCSTSSATTSPTTSPSPRCHSTWSRSVRTTISASCCPASRPT